MRITYTIPNDYASESHFRVLMDNVMAWAGVTEDDIDETLVWEYLFAHLPAGSRYVDRDDFSETWDIPSDTSYWPDVPGFWKTCE